jgi:hypothetical protein
MFYSQCLAVPGCCVQMRAYALDTQRTIEENNPKHNARVSMDELSFFTLIHPL